MKSFTKACRFAAEKHENQRRKNRDTPYINHPLEVADLLAQAGVDDLDVLCAAVLHDTLQDTQTSPQELLEQFNSRVRDIVMQCSDDKALSKAERKRLQIKKAGHASKEGRLVKLADKLSNNASLNVCPPLNWTKERILGYMVWSQRVCEGLKGLNEQLDLQIAEVFAKGGLGLLQPEEKEKLLQQYIKLMNKVE